LKYHLERRTISVWVMSFYIISKYIKQQINFNLVRFMNELKLLVFE